VLVLVVVVLVVVVLVVVAAFDWFYTSQRASALQQRL
jgi:Tfp pilus assembly protein PilX